MANIKSKPINELDQWNAKELRKLKMVLKNRIEVLKTSAKPKELNDPHPLKDFDLDQCNELLNNIQKAEKLKR